MSVACSEYVGQRDAVCGTGSGFGYTYSTFLSVVVYSPYGIKGI